MSITADRVIVELEAKLGRYEANIARAEQKFDRAMGNIQKSATRTEGMISRAAGAMGASLGAISVALLAREFLDLTDKAKSLEAQLRLATKESGSFAQAQEDVRRVAATTRSGLEATALLYGNFQRNARELGITQKEAARATETVAKTFKISGAGAIEAAQGTRQLVQALQSGVLRGDEFNTIMESSPRLARLLADSLGVTVGELRAMAEAGKLTSEQLVRAFTDTKFTEGIDAEFRELPKTFSEAMQQIENAAIITFGAFDRGGQFSTMLANFITDGAEGFGKLEKSAEAFGKAASIEIAGVIGSLQGLSNALAAVDVQFGGLLSRLAQDAWIFQLANPLGAIGYALQNNTFAAQGRANQAAFLNRGQGNFAGRYLDKVGAGFGAAQPAMPRAAGGGAKAAGRKRAGGAGRSRAARPADDPLADFIDDNMADLSILSHTWVNELRDLHEQELDDEVSRLRAIRNEDFDERKRMNEELSRKQEQQVQTLAGLYQSAFRGGTKAIWQDFKQIGLAVIAEVLARFTISRLNGTGGSLLSFLGPALSSALPGFASGGSFMVGGRGGQDRNTLSLNGRPIANVSRGERVHVSNEALGRGGGATIVQHITVDARNSVNPEGFAREILAISGRQAAQAAATMGKAVIKGAPQRMAQFSRDGI